MRALARDGCEVSATVLSGGLSPGTAAMNIDLLNIDRGRSRLARAVPVLRRRLGELPSTTVIVASGLWGAAPVAAALLGTGRSYVSWEHSVLPPRLRIDKRVLLLFRIIDTPALRPRQVIAVSEGVRAAVSTHWPDCPISVIPNIVEAPQRPPAPPRPASLGDEVRLLTTGAFRPYKNYVCAVEAMQHLSGRFTMRMAGDGRQFSQLRALAEQAGISARVQFLGRVPSVDSLLADSHLLVHPSLSETFGFSLVEAADAGVPVVTLAAPAIEEMVPRYVPGVMADGLTAESLANAVETAARRTWTAEDQAISWRRRSEAFSARAVAEAWRSAVQTQRDGSGRFGFEAGGMSSK